MPQRRLTMIETGCGLRKEPPLELTNTKTDAKEEAKAEKRRRTWDRVYSGQTRRETSFALDPAEG